VERGLKIRENAETAESFNVRLGIVWHLSDPVCFASMRTYASLVKSSQSNTFIVLPSFDPE
jgi:hypothetical protein